MQRMHIRFVRHVKETHCYAIFVGHLSVNNFRFVVNNIDLIYSPVCSFHHCCLFRASDPSVLVWRLDGFPFLYLKLFVCLYCNLFALCKDMWLIGLP